MHSGQDSGFKDSSSPHKVSDLWSYLEQDGSWPGGGVFCPPQLESRDTCLSAKDLEQASQGKVDRLLLGDFPLESLLPASIESCHLDQPG